jgi:hypothetical protein
MVSLKIGEFSTKCLAQYLSARGGLLGVCGGSHPACHQAERATLQHGDTRISSRS